MKIFILDYLNRFDDIFNQIEEAIVNLPTEGLNWVPGEEMNSIAVLTIHALKSSRYWIGDMVLQDDSQRVREEEFIVKGAEVESLLKLLSETKEYLHNHINDYANKDFSQEVTTDDHQQNFTVGWCMLHALEHAASHLGHIQVTKQIWEQKINNS